MGQTGLHPGDRFMSRIILLIFSIYLFLFITWSGLGNTTTWSGLGNTTTWSGLGKKPFRQKAADWT